MEVDGHFTIRRFWLKANTPKDILDTLNNVRWGNPRDYTRAPYIDISYYGEADRNITFMEMRYGEWIDDRQDIHYTVKGDDGL